MRPTKQIHSMTLPDSVLPIAVAKWIYLVGHTVPQALESRLPHLGLRLHSVTNLFPSEKLTLEMKFHNLGQARGSD